MLAAERLAQLDLDAYRAEKPSKPRMKKPIIHSPPPKPHGRRRSRISDVEEAHSFRDDSGSYTDNEPDEMDGFIETKRSISRHGYGPQRKAVPRSNGLKDDLKVRRSKFGGPPTQSSRSLGEYAMAKKSRHYAAAPRTRHRSHYHIDIEDDGSDGSDGSEMDIVPKRGRLRGKRDQLQPKFSSRRRSSSSSTSSSPESAGSSEELPKVPLPVPVPPPYTESRRRHKSLGHGQSSAETASQSLIYGSACAHNTSPTEPS